MKSKIKQRLQDKVTKLSQINNGSYPFDMTDQMFTIYSWALNNASIKQLRKWKKEFKS
jgi:hypothetical protein